MQRRRFTHAIKQHFIAVTVFEGELQVTLNGMAQRARLAHCGKHSPPRLKAESAENIVPVAIALVDRGRSSARRLGHGAHGERLFAPACPQPRGRTENSLFQIRVGMPRHVASDDERLFVPGQATRESVLEFPPSPSYFRAKPVYFSTRMNSPVEALTATVNFAPSRLAP